MPNYKYRVIFEDGKIGRGKIVAQSRAQAIDMLKKITYSQSWFKKCMKLNKRNLKDLIMPK